MDRRLQASPRRSRFWAAAHEWYRQSAPPDLAAAAALLRHTNTTVATAFIYPTPRSSVALLLKGLPPSTTKDDVFGAFEQVGGTDVKIVPDATGQLTATVWFTSADQAETVHTNAKSAHGGKGLKFGGKFILPQPAAGDPRSGGPAGGGGVAAAAIQAAMAMSNAAKAQASVYGGGGGGGGAAPAPAAPPGGGAQSVVVPAGGMLQGVPETLMYHTVDGYYYDSATGYYYDSSSGYYYDGKAGLYYWWDATTKKYTVATKGSGTAATTATTAAPGASGSVAPAVGLAQATDAKKVAADMEKWAKKRKREVEKDKSKKLKLTLKRPADKLATAAGGSAVGAAAVAFTASTAPEKEEEESQGGWTLDPALDRAKASSEEAVSDADDPDDVDPDDVALPEEASLLAQYSKPGTDLWEAAVARGHVDVGQGACLLCQRGLGTEAKLQKHVQSSKLHATNLTTAKDKIVAALSPVEKEAFDKAIREASYRDRAAERRSTFGQSKKAPKRRATSAAKRADAASAPVVQPNRGGIAESNLGSKMLKKMGWSKGEGLGKAGQGITAPIQAQKHVSGAGIGAAPVLSTEEATDDSYKGHALQMTRARYKQL